MCQFAVRFLGKAEIVGAVDGYFLCDFEDLANDVEIVFLRFFVDHAVGRKSSDHAESESDLPLLPNYIDINECGIVRGVGPR